MGGLVDETTLQPISLRQVCERVVTFHRMGFLWEISAASAIVAAWLVTRALARRDSPKTALLLVPLAIGVANVVAMPQGASVHEYWQIYLAPGIAFPFVAPAMLAMSAPERARRVLAATGLAVLAVCAVHAHGRTAARWAAREPERDAMRRAGERIAAQSSADQWVLTDAPRSVMLAGYCDRRFVALETDLAQLVGRKQQVAHFVAAFALRAPTSTKARAALSELRMEGPLEAPGLEIWLPQR